MSVLVLMAALSTGCASPAEPRCASAAARLDTTAVYTEADTTWFANGDGVVQYHSIVRRGFWPAPVPANETLQWWYTVEVQRASACGQ